MQVSINVDTYEVDRILLVGLKEYYEYLRKHPFESDDGIEPQHKIENIIPAFEIVLQQYMTEREYKEYIDTLNH